MGKVIRCARLIAPAMAALLCAPAALAATCTSIATGNWSAATTWSCVGVPAATVPGASDSAVIASPHTVTLTAATSAINLTINAGGVLSDGNFNLTMSGNLLLNGSYNGGGTGRLIMSGNNVTLDGAGSLNNINRLDAVANTTKTILATANLTFTGANARIAVRTNNTLINNGAVTLARITGASATSVWTNAAGSALNISADLLTTGTLNASAAGNTVNYNGAAQTVKAPTTTGYYHLTLSGSGVKTMPPPVIGGLNIGGNFTMSGTVSVTAADAIFVSGNFSLGAGTTFNNGIFGHKVGGNFTNSGTYVPSTGSINFTGAVPQTLTGATTFYRILVSNPAGLSLASNITVSNMVIFNIGNITTNANTLIATGNCAGSVARSSGHVVGNLRKYIPAGASTCTFEVGSGADYAPVVATFVAGTTAGNITASTTGAEHPSIASSGIDPAKSVNRYWTLTNGGVALPVAGFSATFNFINGSPVDFDAGAVPANFIAQRWNGAAWSATTLNATCTATPAANLCKQVNGLGATDFGDFAIGEQVSAVITPGSFNAFETGTGAGAITGRIYTKLAGVAPALDIVAISGGAQLNTFTNTVIVELLGNQTAGVPLDAQNCPTSFTLIQTVTPNPTVTGGRSTVNFAAVANAWRDVRVRVRFPVASPSVISCSTDNFSIRPTAFTVTSSNAGNSGVSGAPAIRTGTAFNLTAASIPGYNGTPAINNSPGMITGTPNQGTIGGSFAAASPATGTATGNAFFYSEAGNFGLAANAVYDSTFTSVDQPGDCTADFSNAVVGGRYGCSFGTAAVPLVIGSSGFGRFIPDNFNVATNTPAFGTACGTFGYIGQVFSFATAPVLTVAARQGTANGLTNAVTTNYAGAYMKLTNASLGQAPYDTTAGRYARFDALGGGTTPALDTSGLPPAASDPVIGTFTNGVGTLTFGAGAGLLFTRSLTAPNAPFNADIALALNVVDADGVAFAGNPAAFGAAAAGNGIAFSGGKEMRFGRLRLANAHGSELLNLPVPVQAQYWNGASFVTNIADNCTTLAANNIALTAPPAGVSAITGGAFLAGAGSLTLTRPATAAKVSVDLCVDLGADPVGGTVCSAAASAARSYLQGVWAPGSSYNNDPGARATFGVYKSSNEFIYLRENY